MHVMEESIHKDLFPGIDNLSLDWDPCSISCTFLYVSYPAFDSSVTSHAMLCLLTTFLFYQGVQADPITLLSSILSSQQLYGTLG